jgi:hypothetical protein
VSLLALLVVISRHRRETGALWKESCPDIGRAGLCIAVQDLPGNEPLRRRCGPEHQVRAIVIPRDRDAVAAALPGLDGEHQQLARLDLELEHFVAAEPPASHDLASVGPWVASRTARIDGLAAAYSTLSRSERPDIAQLAAARAVESYRLLEDEVFAIELPGTVRDGSEDELDAYCDALTTSADALEERAHQAMDHCWARSVELGFVAPTPSCDFDLQASR